MGVVRDEVKDDNGASQRVYRGGGWGNNAAGVAGRHRRSNPPSRRSDSLGLRLARVPVGKESK